MRQHLPPFDEEETIGVKEVLSRRAGAARRLLQLGATAGAFAFASAYTGAHYLASPSSSGDQLAVAATPAPVARSALAGACSDAATAQAQGVCFNGATQSFKCEWLLWKARAPLASPPAALNGDEEEVALHRFDGVAPLTLALPLNEQAHLGTRAEVTDTTTDVTTDVTTDTPTTTDFATVVAADAGTSSKKAKEENAEALESAKDAKQSKAAGQAASVPHETAGRSEGGRKRARKRRLASSSGNDADATTPAFTVSMSNAYTAKSGGYSAEYPWAYIAEPFRATTLAVVDGTSPNGGASGGGGSSYRWTVDGHVQGYGASVAATFQEVGYHAVTVERISGHASDDGGEANDDEEEAVAVTVNVMVKYVRREVRSMSDADREAWLSAVQVLQHVPTTAGQALYGANYYSKDHFTRLHLYYGGALDCDHWHQGAGFVTSHVALTLMWEQALQSVNPTVAAPYWDFTLDSTFYGAKDWATSFVFADDWFGAANPANDLHTPDAGRFGFVYTMADASEYSDWVNSYGLMRAPWNADPTPFLTRSGRIYGYENNMKPSGCSEYATAIKKTSWMSMSKQLNAAAHGHIHELVGGSWNHAYAAENNGSTSPAVYTFAHQIQALSKMLWRDGYVTCPSSCSMATPSAACQCTANLAKLGGKPAGQVLQEVGILAATNFYDEGFHSLSSTDFLDASGAYKPVIDGFTEAASTHTYAKLLEVLVNPGHLGDMFQATSSNDITFWTIHLTVDRLWHYKRLGNLGNYDETWDPFHTCYGHNPRNVQPFKNLFGEAGEGAFVASAATTNDGLAAVGAGGGESTARLGRRLGGDGASGAAPARASADPSASSSTSPAVAADTYYTNMELYSLLHPASRQLQYVYDNFNWAHCDQTGYEITNLW